MVRSGIHNAERTDDNKPSTPRRAITTARFKPLIRRFSESQSGVQSVKARLMSEAAAATRVFLRVNDHLELGNEN